MAAHIFRNADQAFAEWLARHPDGYVVNTNSKPSKNYFVLHRARCSSLSSSVEPGGYTARNYMKACTSDVTPSSLEAWIRLRGGPGFTKLCTRCNPIVSALGSELTGQSTPDFEDQVANSKALSPGERARRMSGGDSPPAFYMTTTVVFARSPHVVAEVLERAAGRCERCAEAAPFLRARDGTPYLEVHHLIRLADGGLDTVDNAIALCPNCHRECHHGQADA